MANRSKQSAGLLMYRRSARGLEVFLAHPGGPFFARKDLGAWTIPKGEPNPGEVLVACALREFEEETGMKPEGELLELGEVQQAGGKRVAAWAFEGDFGERELRCNQVRDRVAAPQRQDAQHPGDRPRRVLHGRRGAPRRSIRHRSRCSRDLLRAAGMGRCPSCSAMAKPFPRARRPTPRLLAGRSVFSSW